MLCGLWASVRAVGPIFFIFSPILYVLWYRINARKVVLKFFKNQLRFWPKILKFKPAVFIFEKPGCGLHLAAESQNRGSSHLTRNNEHFDIKNGIQFKG